MPNAGLRCAVVLRQPPSLVHNIVVAVVCTWPAVHAIRSLCPAVRFPGRKQFVHVYPRARVISRGTPQCISCAVAAVLSVTND